MNPMCCSQVIVRATALQGGFLAAGFSEHPEGQMIQLNGIYTPPQLERAMVSAAGEYVPIVIAA